MTLILTCLYYGFAMGMGFLMFVLTVYLGAMALGWVLERI